MGKEHKDAQHAAEQRHYAKLRAQGYVQVTGKDGKTTLQQIKK